MTDDVKIPQRISQAYRELGTEEPPRALDQAILAAALHGRRRWSAPLATAAVLVLAVAVTLNMQRERPGVESPVTQAPPPHADQSAEKISAANAEAELKLRAAAELKLKPRAETPPAARPAAAPAAAPVPAAREPQPFAAAQAPSPGPAFSRSDDARGTASSVTGELARKTEERTARDAEAAALTPRLGAFQAQKRAESPERELERIADLRVQGRHDEADRALAEFRKRHPDYRIADAMRERLERR